MQVFTRHLTLSLSERLLLGLQRPPLLHRPSCAGYTIAPELAGGAVLVLAPPEVEGLFARPPPAEAPPVV